MVSGGLHSDIFSLDLFGATSKNNSYPVLCLTARKENTYRPAHALKHTMHKGTRPSAAAHAYVMV